MKDRDGMRYSNDKNEYYRIKVKIHLMLKNTDSTFDVSNITGFLACDHHKEQIANIFNSWRNDSFNYMNTISDKMKANRTRKKRDEAASAIQSQVRGRQTRKKNAASTIQAQVRGRQTRKKKLINRKKRTRGARNIQKLFRGRRTRKKLGSNPRDQALFSKEKKRNDEVIASQKRAEESEIRTKDMEDRLNRLRE